MRKTRKASFKTVGDLLISFSTGRCSFCPKGHDILWGLCIVYPVYGTLLYTGKTAEVKPASHINLVPSLKEPEAKPQIQYTPSRHGDYFSTGTVYLYLRVRAWKYLAEVRDRPSLSWSECYGAREVRNSHSSCVTKK